MAGNLHPNGFVIRLLRTFKNGMRLRLHTWPKHERRLDTPHDHRSWFVSLPLWGQFIEKRYEENTRGVPVEILRCHSTSGNGQPITTSEGHSALVERSSRVRRAGVPYFCPAEAVHSFVPTTSFAASLVLFGPQKQVPRAFVKPEAS